MVGFPFFFFLCGGRGGASRWGRSEKRPMASNSRYGRHNDHKMAATTCDNAMHVDAISKSRECGWNDLVSIASPRADARAASIPRGYSFPGLFLPTVPRDRFFWQGSVISGRAVVSSHGRHFSPFNPEDGRTLCSAAVVRISLTRGPSAVSSHCPITCLSFPDGRDVFNVPFPYSKLVCAVSAGGVGD
jgi:hypothetical protein